MTRPSRGPGPWIVSAAITSALFLEAPGRVAPETKLDLAVDPIRFMGRALRLWDPQAAFGHLQNQAAGYLFPTGPFFAVGQMVHLPMWAVQRAWMAGILVAALWGALRVAEALEIGTPSTRLLGASAYALSPALLSQIAYTSGGQLPGALMPWALLALIRGSRTGSPRRWAAASGAAVATMGAVNATATIGALVLPALFLLTRARGPRRAALVRWWILAVGLATAWWVIPLLLQGRYGFNFLPYTESAAVTSATTSAFEVVRGTGYWLSYLVAHGPWLPAGWTLVSLPIAVAATGAVAAGGLFGLGRRDMPERSFLVLALGLGTAVVAAGYGGALSGPLDGPVRELLTGALAPLRNLHKFEPVLRLPLALGLCHAAATARVPRVRPRSLVIGTAVAVALTAAPAWRGEIVVAGSFERIPTYWKQTAHWLDAHAAQSRSLLVPSAAFGEYRWGRPLDEPLQPLARSAWAVRDLIPLGSDSTTRVLDGINQRLDRAEPGIGLAADLGRAGVRFVVVRNDLDLSRTGAPPPAQIRRALAQSPGLRLVRRLGPPVEGGWSTARLAPDMTGNDYRAVEIYEVTGSSGPVTVEGAGAAVRMAGGPEGLLALAGAGLAAGPVRLGGEATTGRPVVTDSWRRRDVDFGAVRDNYSYVLTEHEPAPASGEPPRDHIPAPPAPNRSPAVMRGAARLLDSSAGTRSALPEHQPYAAFDGERDTAWIAPPSRPAVGAWIEVRLARAVSPGAITVAPLRDRPSRPAVTRVRITTAAGARTSTLAASEARQSVAVVPGPTTRIRLTIEAIGQGRGNVGAGLRAIEIGGLHIDRTLAVPSTGSSAVPTYVFERSRSDPYDLGRTDEETRLRRLLVADAADRLTVAGTASGRPGTELDQLVGAHRDVAAGGATASASSTWRGLPAFAPPNAVDGDPTTAWLADPDDTRPAFRVSWPTPRTITNVRVQRAPGPTRVPTRLRLSAGGETRDVRLDRNGSARVAALVADAVDVRVLATSPTPVARAGTSPFVRAAVGAAEVRLGPVPTEPTPPSGRFAVTLPCGSGPPVLVDGVRHETAVEGTLADLVALRPVRVTGCDQVTVTPGEHRVEGLGSGPLTIDTLVLTPPGGHASPAKARAVGVTSWGPEDRRVTVGPGGDTYLGVAENFNRGWHATLNGRSIEPVRLDGWKQGWRVPPGQGGVVHLTFAPGRLYRAGLALGAVGLLVLVLLALRRHEDARPASPARQAGVPPVALLAVVLLGALGGIAGLIAAGVASMTRRRAVLAVVAALGATVIATAGAGSAPATDAGPFAPAVQALTLLALAAVLVPARDRD